MELQKVTIEKPTVEGFEVKDAYLNDVELNNENLLFTSKVENGNIIIEITEGEESELNQFIEFESSENIDDETVILNNIAKEYIVLYVLEGTADVNSFSIKAVEELNYSDNTSTLSTELRGEIIKTEKIDNDFFTEYPQHHEKSEYSFQFEHKSSSAIVMLCIL